MPVSIPARTFQEWAVLHPPQEGPGCRLRKDEPKDLPLTPWVECSTRPSNTYAQDTEGQGWLWKVGSGGSSQTQKRMCTCVPPLHTYAHTHARTHIHTGTHTRVCTHAHTHAVHRPNPCTALPTEEDSSSRRFLTSASEPGPIPTYLLFGLFKLT